MLRVSVVSVSGSRNVGGRPAACCHGDDDVELHVLGCRLTY